MIFLKLLLVFHVLGDFYTQTRRVNELKKQKLGFLFLHVLIYTLPFVLLFWLSDNLLMSVVVLALISGSHILIDILKIAFEKKGVDKRVAFLVDQILHLAIIFVSFYLLRESFIAVSGIDSQIQSWGFSLGVVRIVSILLVFLIVIKPASMIVELMLPMQKSGEDTNPYAMESGSKDESNYGEYIGILERIVIVILGMLNLWSSIALVITAKSIARFKQLEDKQFAQKYLIGTLLSVIISLMTLLIFL